MRPYGTAEQLERRRRRAVGLVVGGASLRAAAGVVKASVSSAHRWYQAYQEKGWEGLRPVPTPGRPRKLGEAQRRKLLEWLRAGPQAAGYSTQLWTLKRVAELIERRFGVRYHPCHVWKVLRGLGWSCQKPERCARERDEHAIRRWRGRRWSRLKKSPARVVQPRLSG